MTPAKALVFAADVLAAKMFEEDAEGLSIAMAWHTLDESLREAYRAAARREIEEKP